MRSHALRGTLNLRIVTTCRCLLLALVFAAAVPASGDVRLPQILGNHMVVQRDVPVPVWGWADPGEEVTVTFAGHEASTKADANGAWIVKLPPLKAGGPHEMMVSGKNTLRLMDVLVGEVWLASGQSNMEWNIGRTQDGQAEIAAADYPKIRLFHVPRQASGQPLLDVNASWRACSPETIGGFSAVAYFFGRELHKELAVPIGLINSSFGGTRIEPWTPPEGFALVPELEEISQQIGQAKMNYRDALGPALGLLKEWIREARKALDEGREVPPRPNIPRHPLDDAGKPTGLYNGMIYALVPFGIRGAIWYQGEANVLSNDGMAYYDKMKALIGGWRQVWGQGDFPFYSVQLAPFNYRLYWKKLTTDQLPKIWEAQRASLAIPNTGMVVTTDIGNLRDIHPRNKQEVGRRLALWALANTYGRKGLVYSGPLYKAMRVEDGTIRIAFDHVGSGLASSDGKPLTWFEIAGEDKVFVQAEAAIDGETVVVSSDEVAEPVAVRFGWDHAAEPNFINKEGLPASPFRTDRW